MGCFATPELLQAALEQRLQVLLQITLWFLNKSSIFFIMHAVFFHNVCKIT